ncbi:MULTISPECIES: NAD-dependent succinate-semialdehyde dehydrogenase [unclassified Burkholderia]|uniref:NAD-dependent succinate-semialdehyde dehydrogenase n=1 Tax=unclassified Burkholderia TaxID=2613784 RepID=UPI002AB13EDA|nr:MULTISPECIES: NAD-dependent succinate-semialdehyde dehydrogenase [unclassified Burkholderia]
MATHDPLHLYIDGEWITRGNRDVYPVINPATQETIGEVPIATTDDLDRALESSERAFRTWKCSPAHERARILSTAARLLRERAEPIARLLVLEQGKPHGEALWELGFAADLFDWYAGEAVRSYGRVLPRRVRGGRSYVLREPVGPVAGFSPWNVPVVLGGSKIAASLATGCTIIIKPAEETPSAILQLARVLEEAGLPRGVLNMVFGTPSDVSSHLIASPIIRKVSFTGSTPVGRHLATLAAPGLKRVTLELGGHAPVIIFPDADIEAAAALTAGFKFFNAGQVCFTPTRFFVHESVHDRFVAAFSRHVEALRVGSGLDEATNMGPLANARRLTAMESLTEDAVAAGATLVSGGHRLGDKGYFFEPTLLADVPLSARVMREEPFGPIAMTSRFSTFDEAVERANSLPYGLSAFAFTRSAETANSIADALECGLVGINNCVVASVDAPFGGVKDSGYGSDFGAEGLDAFLTTKYVHQTP